MVGYSRVPFETVQKPSKIPLFIPTLNFFQPLGFILLLSERLRSPQVLFIFSLQRYFTIDGTYPAPIIQDTEGHAQGHKDKCDKAENDTSFCVNILTTGSFFICGGHNFATHSNYLKWESRKSFISFSLGHVLYLLSLGYSGRLRLVLPLLC